MRSERVNRRTLAIITIGALMLGAMLVTNGLSIGDKALGYESSQAASLANTCGNGDDPFNILCQNLFSQIQGDGNAVNIIGLQTGGERTTPSPPDCTEVEGTLWSVTLLQEIDGLPAGSVICLLLNDPLPSNQDNAVLAPGPQILSVLIFPQSADTGECIEGFVEAEVTSGPQLPVGVEIGDIVCVQGGIP